MKDYQKAMMQRKRDELIVSHLPLVKHVLGRVICDLFPGADMENLESAGILGLVEAANKFDPAHKTQFKTFAYLRVRGAILDELRRNCPLPQQMIERVSKVKKAYRMLEAPVTVEMLAVATKMTEDEVTETLTAMRLTKMISWEQTAQPNGLAMAEHQEAPEAELERWEQIEQLTEAIESLDERSRSVMVMYYKEDMRLKEISKVLGLSESRVSRIMTAATFELGERLRAKEKLANEPLNISRFASFSRVG
jgi:RNA polymerase sigma factor for flagellar operon FliA